MIEDLLNLFLGVALLLGVFGAFGTLLCILERLFLPSSSGSKRRWL